ncbi:MAG: hypothetical protein JWS12_99 [Candidatus Saccharibacteria bacterium]|nr:hypothetical protein [Candidatus Saccharibacteria bacterium]
MKFFRNYKYQYDQKVSYPRQVVLSFLFVTFLLISSANFILIQGRLTNPLFELALPWEHSTTSSQDGQVKGVKSNPNKSTKSSPVTGSGSSKTSGTGTSPSSNGPVDFKHLGIITTYFWAGEDATGANGHIPNAASAWDEQWSTHYGGIDNPASRNGYFPASFTPKENPFYFALPYNDYDAKGKRKSTAGSCLNSGDTSVAAYSWCKNTWIAIRHNGKVAYAQWEDVGPFQEDDFNYVFGTAPPKNTRDAKAGLDVSPALRSYFGMQDVDTCDWSFVPASSVPTGPWKQIVTTSKGTPVTQ